MSEDFFRLGDRIEHSVTFTILSKIAEGGMGEVYEALLHHPLGFEKRIAVKVVRPSVISGRDAEGLAEPAEVAHQAFLLSLADEASLIANLIHTHINQIYFFGTIVRPDDTVDGFIAMEYVNGVNLRAFIDRHISEGRQIPVDIAVYIISRLARALEYAHVRSTPDGTPLGIVHRDVSPSNVLVSAEGVVKLTDFGIAKALYQRTDFNKMVIGKRRYMAPEQLRGGDVDFRADIFSLGVLLHELLSLQHPGNPENIGIPSTIRPEVPAGVDEIVRRCVAREPRDRFSTTTELAVLLEKSIYERGYGPTFVTMAEYLRDVFPALLREDAAQEGQEERTRNIPPQERSRAGEGGKS